MKKFRMMKQGLSIIAMTLLSFLHLNGQCVLACNNLVNVSLSETGSALITWDMIVEGGPGVCDPQLLSVSLQDQNGATLDQPIVTLDHVGQNLTATVTHELDGNSCWGTILVDNFFQNECPDTVKINVVTQQSNESMLAEFRVYDFFQIASVQMSISYNSDFLSFQEVEAGDLAGLNTSSFNEVGDGVLNMVWFEQNGQSVSLPDSSRIFSLRFDVIGNGEAVVEISSFPLSIEISNADGELVCLYAEPALVDVISNSDCQLDCIQTLQASLNSNDSLTIFPEDFALGNLANCNPDNFQLSLTDQSGNLQISIESITISEAGTYPYTLTDTQGNSSCTGFLEVHPYACLLICNNLINLSLDNNGFATVTLDMVLEGGSCDYNDLQLGLQDENGIVIDPPVLNDNHIGQDILATVTQISTGNSCWSTIRVENFGCALQCIGQLTGLLSITGELTVYALDFIDSNPNCDFSQAELTLIDALGVSYSNGVSASVTSTGDYEYEIVDPATNASCTGILRVLGQNNGGCVDTLGLTLEAEQIGDEILLYLKTTKFINIQSGQFSINYSSSDLSFLDMESSLPGFSSGNINANAGGKIGVVWFDPTGNTPISVPDGTTVFTVRFDPLAITNTELTLTNDPVLIEFTNQLGQIICLDTNATDLDINGSTSPCTLVCNDNVLVNISNNSTVEITSDMVLEGGPYNSCGPLEVEVSDLNGVVLPNSPTINFSSAGEVYNYVVTQTSSANSCWGTITSFENSNSFCVDTVYIDVISSFDGEQVKVDIIGYDFNDIVAMQFALNYDSEVLSFDGTIESTIPGLNETAVNEVDGALLMVWVSSGISPINLPDGANIFTAYFSALRNDNTEISIGDSPNFEIEIINSDLNLLCLNQDPSTVIVDGAHYYGYVVFDDDLSCTQENDEVGLKDWFITLDNGSEVYNFDTDDTGYYSMVVPAGNYTISAHAPNDLWTFCENNVSAVTMSNDEFYNFNFLAIPAEDCPYLTIDLSAPFLRRCFNSKYYLKYCNTGTLAEGDTQINVELDEDLEFVSTDFSNYTVNGQNINFDIGVLDLGDCGTISFEVSVSCDAALGQTHCTEASILPEPNCLGPISSWGGPVLEVEGVCENDSVRFQITNGGTGAMTEPSGFIVIEDDVMRPATNVQLGVGEEAALVYPANGATYRLMGYQDPAYPGDDLPTLALEGCGFDDNGNFSRGFVNMFENTDGNENIDIDCQENIGSFDPNDKQAFPKGYREDHLVYDDTQLEYKLRFQNTGTDTAFRVVVKDTISSHLNLLSIELGSSSHPYVFSLEDSRVLVFTFDNIQLVSEDEDELASNGFVKYKLKQNSGNSDGTLILNKADIFFDFNPAVETNETDHLVGTDFVETTVSTINIGDPRVELSVYPNPFENAAFFELSNVEIRDARIEMHNILGQEVYESKITALSNRLDLSHLNKGAFFFRIINDGRILATGKIIRK